MTDSPERSNDSDATAAQPQTTKPKTKGGNTDRILDHTYDGIQEYDNPMPRWWLGTFAATIVFSVLYLFNIGPIGSGKGWIADYEADMKAFAAAHPAPSGNDVSEAALAALVADKQALAAGKTTFDAYCASCHRQDGGGLIGPNLADSHWLHGGKSTDIYKTVVDGVLAKGMPPWGKSLKPEQLKTVVAYVVSLHGTNPVNPKAPQGELVTP
jgi:cytochrome c oxidase cbb3-type subunit 3